MAIKCYLYRSMRPYWLYGNLTTAAMHKRSTPPRHPPFRYEMLCWIWICRVQILTQEKIWLNHADRTALSLGSTSWTVQMDIPLKYL